MTDQPSPDPSPGDTTEQPTAPAATGDNSSPTPRRKRRWLPYAIGAAAVLLVVLTVSLAAIAWAVTLGPYSGREIAPAEVATGTTNPGGGPTTTTPGEDIPVPPPADDNPLQVELVNVDCSQSTITSEYFDATADGVFCVTTANVRNNSDRPINISTYNLTAFDAERRRYAADDDGTLAGGDSWAYEPINPGATKEIKAAFDVPQGVQVNALEVAASEF